MTEFTFDTSNIPRNLFSKIALNCFNGPMMNPSYLSGSFLCLADFLRANGGEWVPTHSSSPSEPLSIELYESESDYLSISWATGSSIVTSDLLSASFVSLSLGDSGIFLQDLVQRQIGSSLLESESPSESSTSLSSSSSNFF